MPELEADERALVERRDELVALACELIAFDTTSRSAPDEPPRDELGGLGSWYDGATFAPEARTPALMYGPRAIDRAHTVDEHVPIDDLVACAQASPSRAAGSALRRAAVR